VNVDGTYHAFEHAASRNDDRYLSLTGTATALGSEPRDDATEALAASEPGGERARDDDERRHPAAPARAAH